MRPHSKPRFPLAYFLACALLYALALPLLLFSCLRAKHRDSIPARFFMPKSLPCEPRLWFHACSFGEVRSLEPLIRELGESEGPILITTITHTGYAEARRLYESKHIIVRYLPFELLLPLWRGKLGALKCLIVLEAEMWKMLFYLAKARGAHTLLLNARISTRSLKSYTRFAWFYRGIFTLIDSVLAQSKSDKQRLESLGASNVEVFGNLKSLNPPRVSTPYAKPSRPLFIAASTHRGEEELIIESFKTLLDKRADSHPAESSTPLLLLVPRHPERFDEVCELAKRHFARVSIFSHSRLDEAAQSDVVVVDVLGELINLYAIADVVVLGGGFAENVGGHNPLEVAHFGARLISGEHIFNQHALFEEVEGYVLLPSSALSDTLRRWESLPPSRIIQPSTKKLAALMVQIRSEDE